MGSRSPAHLTLFALVGCAPVTASTANPDSGLGGDSGVTVDGGVDGGASDGGGVDSGGMDSGGDGGGASGDGGQDVEEVPEAPAPSDILFSDDVLPSFEIELSEASIAALRKEPYVWVEGALVYDGERYEPVGVRTKGENSWQSIDEKPSLKVKLDWSKDGPGELLGLTDLTLQNMDNDYTMMHERVAYRLYRAFGVPAPRATHAWVTINGDDYGLYTHLETVDKRMIGRWFEDDDGPLFEHWDVDYYDQYISMFELEYGEDDRTALQGVADAMENGNPTTAIAEADPYLDWDAFLAYWAVSAVVGQFDSYPYTSPGDDCHAYRDPTSGKLVYLPHGMDEAFYYPDHDVVSNAIGILTTACRFDGDCQVAFEAKVWEVLDVAAEIDLLAYSDFVDDQIEDLIELDPRKPYTSDTITYYQREMRSFIDGREAEMRRQIGARP
jgi:CotH kinase protein